MKLMYIKKNSHRPESVGKVIAVLPDEHVFTAREMETKGHAVLFGILQVDEIDKDNIALCESGRRKVNDVDNPTGIISID
jgi:hypothetical protein